MRRRRRRDDGRGPAGVARLRGAYGGSGVTGVNSGAGGQGWPAQDWPGAGRNADAPASGTVAAETVAAETVAAGITVATTGPPEATGATEATESAGATEPTGPRCPGASTRSAGPGLPVSSPDVLVRACWCSWDSGGR